MYRPGGLTALAVFNFVIAGWFVLTLMAVLLSLGSGAESDGKNAVPQALLYAQAGYLPVAIGLLITSGIGYLKLKRVLGRYLGSAEAVAGLVFFGVSIYLYKDAGRPFSFQQLTHLVYPGLVLVLLNVVFRENLVN